MTLCLNKGYHPNVHDSSKIPATKHWAIITFDEVTVTNGYPNDATTTKVANYHVFTDKAEWVSALQQLAEQNMTAYTKQDFVGIEVNGKATVTVKVTATVG